MSASVYAGFDKQNERITFKYPTDVQNGFTASNVGIGTTTALARMHVYHTGTGDVLRVDDETAPDTTPFIINQNGSVGIGTHTALQRLHVQGDALITGKLHYNGDLQTSNLTVLGHAQFSSNMNVMGIAQFSSNVNVSSNLNVLCNVVVNGEATLNGGLNVTGNTIINGTLQTTGFQSDYLTSKYGAHRTLNLISPNHVGATIFFGSFEDLNADHVGNISGSTINPNIGEVSPTQFWRTKTGSLPSGRQVEFFVANTSAQLCVVSWYEDLGSQWNLLHLTVTADDDVVLFMNNARVMEFKGNTTRHIIVPAQRVCDFMALVRSGYGTDIHFRCVMKVISSWNSWY